MIVPCGFALGLLAACGLGFSGSAAPAASCDGDGNGAACELGDDSFSALQARSVSASPALTLPGPGFLDEIIHALQQPDANVVKNQYGDPHVKAGDCYIGPDGGCPITAEIFDHPKNEYVHVYPGGQTACLDGSAFYFQVSKGDLDKVHLHFQGGGACWNRLTFSAPLCFTSVYDNPPSGIFDCENPLNPLANYTIVVVSYCSGDIHGGNISQPWGMNGTLVPQKGFFNSNTTIQWILEQFPKLSKFAISGVSGGSLGVQLWAGELLRRFKSRVQDVYLIADSFVGVVWPPSILQISENFLLHVWNLCNPAFLTDEQLRLCNSNRVLIQQVWVWAMEDNPSARFSMLNSKADFVQILFEKAFELTAEFNILGALMTNGEFYKSMSLQLEGYVKQPNFWSYLVQGNQHTFLPWPNLYNVTPLGPEANEGKPLMIDWLTDFVDPEANAPKTVCLGPKKYICPKTIVGCNQTKWCASKLASSAYMRI